MTNGLLLAFLILQAASGSPLSLAALAGKWATTTVPPPGEAPMIAPTFTVDIVDKDVTVTIASQGQDEHYPAKVFRTQTGESILHVYEINRAGRQPDGNNPVRFLEDGYGSRLSPNSRRGHAPQTTTTQRTSEKATPLDH